MANGFGSLWIGASGIQSSSNGLNTTANNLSNVNTEGYVREQVVYQDRSYIRYGKAAISDQYSGLGVEIGTVVHARDIFLDKAYRTENGRRLFYSACSEAVQEVYTHLQESDGEAFENAIVDFYGAFAEFAKDPSDTVNQNLVLQKAGLFLSRASAVQRGFEDYQVIINRKIRDDVARINKIGKEIVKLNKQVQTIEAAKKGECTPVEQAMNLRDTRDLLLDELAGLCRMSYREDINGIVYVDIEGVEFVNEVTYNEIGMYTDLMTGYVTPYWTQLSAPENEDYYSVFNMDNISAENGSDLGEIKALLLARGDHKSSYVEFVGVDSYDYERGIGNSIMMNSEAELDTLIHQMVTIINDLYSPIDEASVVYKDVLDKYRESTGAAVVFTYKDPETGMELKINGSTRVCDVNNSPVGSDDELPPRELFVRNGCERYTAVVATLKDSDGNVVQDENGEDVTQVIYLYNEEMVTFSDVEGAALTVPVKNYSYKDGDRILNTSMCYSLKNIDVNEELVERESLLPYKNIGDKKIDYELGANLEKMWSNQNFNLNPSDTTPCSFQEFYVKWIGEIGTTGSVYETTTKSLEGTSEQIEASRQGVIGVSSDEELTSMIKYQQAYNAASRYINVVDAMIEHLLTSLGH